MEKIDLTQLSNSKSTSKNADKFDNYRITQPTEDGREVTVAYINIVKTATDDVKSIMDLLVANGVFAGFYVADERVETPVKSGLSALQSLLAK